MLLHVGDYEPDAWKRLGREVEKARRQAGVRDIDQWAATIGRSVRQARGLERGERVGDETLERVELALGWPLGRCEVILAGDWRGTDTQPVGYGLDAEADGLPLEDVEAVRAQVRALKRARGID